jgi:hypothetical protein
MRRGSSELNTTVMKTPKHGGLQRTDRAVTTCRLPLQFRGVEHNPRYLSSTSTMPKLSATDLHLTQKAYEETPNECVALTQTRDPTDHR